MHKEEASSLFEVLGNENRVKILKMLYNVGDLTLEHLDNIMEIDINELTNDLMILKEHGLVNELENHVYECNNSKVDELMDFVRTPCGCCKK